MIYLTGSIGGTSRRDAFAANPELGMLLSPKSWRYPWCRFYALDNDMYNAWKNGDHDYWERDGETRWLKMLDKVPPRHTPLWAALPDVVTNWDATIERAHLYRREVESRGMAAALVLQDGSEHNGFLEAINFAPDTVFVGGTKAWKWRWAKEIARLFACHFINVHIGKVNGTSAIRICREIGVASCDGTGLATHFDNNLPKVRAGLYTSPPSLFSCLEF